MANLAPEHLLIAVGSRSDKVCSVGAFARSEAKAYEKFFEKVTLIEPDAHEKYPLLSKVEKKPDIIFFHAPSLYDRKRPWNALVSALKLKFKYPRAKFISIVHEFFEAPPHWRARQIALLKMSDGAIVNTERDLKLLEKWHKHLLRSRLGPTLYDSNLQESLDRKSLEQKIKELRQGSLDEKWILHPGLIVPGKGVNFLKDLAPALPPNAFLILMGGVGPKERDKAFAAQVVSELKSILGVRFRFIESPSDKVYQEMLVAADLVVLPYDIGVSERRSSFLSASSCGGNIWTTTGDVSIPMQIETSGAYTVPVELWLNKKEKALESLKLALNDSRENALERRLKNLKWSRTFSWSNRAKAIQAFMQTL